MARRGWHDWGRGPGSDILTLIGAVVIIGAAALTAALPLMVVLVLAVGALSVGGWGR